MAKIIKEIFDICLIREGENFYAGEPVIVGNMFFDPSALDFYSDDIEEQLVHCVNLNNSDYQKIKALHEALEKVDRSKDYDEAYRCRMIDKDINSLLKLFGLYCILRNDTSCYIFNGKQYKEASIQYDDIGCYSINTIFKGNIDFEMVVTTDEDLGTAKRISITNNETGNHIFLFDKDNNNCFSAEIFKPGDKNINYNLLISDTQQFMQVAMGLPKHLDESKMEEDEEEVPKRFSDGDVVRFLKIDLNGEEDNIPFEIGEVSVENDEIDGGIRSLTFDEPYFEEILESIIYHPRNIELLDVIIDTLDDNLIGIKEYLFERYPILKKYKTVSLPTNYMANEIMDEIYNSNCDFGDKNIFKGYDTLYK